MVYLLKLFNINTDIFKIIYIYYLYLYVYINTYLYEIWYEHYYINKKYITTLCNDPNFLEKNSKLLNYATNLVEIFDKSKNQSAC